MVGRWGWTATGPADFLMDGVLSAETDGEAEEEGGHREGAAVHSVSVCLGRRGSGVAGCGPLGHPRAWLLQASLFSLTELLLFRLPCVGSEKEGLAGQGPGVLLTLNHVLQAHTRFLT